MSLKLMGNVVCNELPVLFLLFYGLIFYSVNTCQDEHFDIFLCIFES